MYDFAASTDNNLRIQILYGPQNESEKPKLSQFPEQYNLPSSTTFVLMSTKPRNSAV